MSGLEQKYYTEILRGKIYTFYMGTKWYQKGKLFGRVIYCNVDHILILKNCGAMSTTPKFINRMHKYRLKSI